LGLKIGLKAGKRANPIRDLTTKEQVLQVYRNFSGVCCDYEYKKGIADNREPDVSEALDYINKKFVFKVPTDTEEILGYIDGCYKPFKCEIKHNLEELYGDNLKRYFVDEVLAHIQRANYIDRSEINKFTNKIPIKNGLFNLLTREIEPFDPEQISLAIVRKSSFKPS